MMDVTQRSCTSVQPSAAVFLFMFQLNDVLIKAHALLCVVKTSLFNFYFTLRFALLCVTGVDLFTVFIMCGSPADVEKVKTGVPEADNGDILFFLIDLYKSVRHSRFQFDGWCLSTVICGNHAALPLLCPHSDQYYFNKSSVPFMRNVLVLTMPKERKYNISNAPENKVSWVTLNSVILYDIT